jgi:aminoglycoside 6'-N-acetyltransferase
LNTETDSIHGKLARGVVSLRPATPEDIDLLRHWDEQPHVIAAKGDEDWQWQAELARQPPWREQLIAEVDGRPIGFLQIIDPARDESRYWGCVSEGRRAIDIWIGDQDDLGRGYGTRMMKLAIERCFSDPTVTALLVDPLDCNQRAHRFYERIGFEYVVCRRFGEDSCFVYRLMRNSARRPAN